MNKQWIAVEDRLPEENTEVIVCINSNSVGVAYYESCGYNLQFHNDHYDNFSHEDVTHWQPFPATPLPQTEVGEDEMWKEVIVFIMDNYPEPMIRKLSKHYTITKKQ